MAKTRTASQLVVLIAMNYGARIFDSFAETPPVLHNRDLIEYPNLDVTAVALWYARFPTDFIIHVSTTFGEEVLTRKFRLVEHGPPLAIEGACKTKEDMEWYLDNVPDPAQRGLYPVFLWTIKQLIKAFPEILHCGSCCAGPIAECQLPKRTEGIPVGREEEPGNGKPGPQMRHSSVLKKS